MFTKTCEYGIRATIYIAEQSLLNRKVGLKEVAKAIESPSAYTSKILQKLSQNNIINSDKGPTGGFSIEREKLEVLKLNTIVSAIDGDSIYTGCGLGLKECNAKMPCPMHNEFNGIRKDLEEMLENSSVKTLAENLQKKLTFLRR